MERNLNNRKQILLMKTKIDGVLRKKMDRN